MRLARDRGEPSSDANIGAVAIRTTECITGKAFRRCLCPSQNHPAVQAARKGHSDRLIIAQITRSDACEDFRQSLGVGCRVELLLFFPRRGIKVSLFLDPAIPVERPHRPARQKGDILKQGAILEHTADREHLGKTSLIDSPKRRKHGEERLCFRRKEEPVRRLVIIDSAQSVTVIEQNRFLLTQIDYQSAEPPVQIFEEFWTLLLVSADLKRGIFAADRPIAVPGGRVSEFLAH